MKNKIDTPERTIHPGAAAMNAESQAYLLNIAGVYEDDVTRNWALDSCRRAAQLAGEERIQDTWYSADSLKDPGTLTEAVRAALVADVIVISIYAVEELPLDLQVWIDNWLARRLSRAGALAAVIGVAEPLGSGFVRTRGYLEEVARKAELDFIPHERPHRASRIKRDAARAGDTAQLLLDLKGQPGNGDSQGKLKD